MIPAEAIEAAERAAGCAFGNPVSAQEMEGIVKILEAAAPHMLADMRPLTVVELEERDNPGMMRAARTQIRAEIQASHDEMLRASRESAYDEGFTACAGEHTRQRKDPGYPITRVNPYRRVGAGAEPMTQVQAAAIASLRSEVRSEWARLAEALRIDRAPTKKIKRSFIHWLGIWSPSQCALGNCPSPRNCPTTKAMWDDDKWN